MRALGTDQEAGGAVKEDVINYSSIAQKMMV